MSPKNTRTQKKWKGQETRFPVYYSGGKDGSHHRCSADERFHLYTSRPNVGGTWTLTVKDKQTGLFEAGHAPYMKGQPAVAERLLDKLLAQLARQQ